MAVWKTILIVAIFGLALAALKWVPVGSHDVNAPLFALLAASMLIAAQITSGRADAVLTPFGGLLTAMFTFVAAFHWFSSTDIGAREGTPTLIFLLAVPLGFAGLFTLASNQYRGRGTNRQDEE